MPSMVKYLNVVLGKSPGQTLRKFHQAGMGCSAGTEGRVMMPEGAGVKWGYQPDDGTSCNPGLSNAARGGWVYLGLPGATRLTREFLEIRSEKCCQRRLGLPGATRLTTGHVESRANSTK